MGPTHPYAVLGADRTELGVRLPGASPLCLCPPFCLSQGHLSLASGPPSSSLTPLPPLTHTCTHLVSDSGPVHGFWGAVPCGRTLSLSLGGGGYNRYHSWGLWSRGPGHLSPERRAGRGCVPSGGRRDRVPGLCPSSRGLLGARPQPLPGYPRGPRPPPRLRAPAPHDGRLGRESWRANVGSAPPTGLGLPFSETAGARQLLRAPQPRKLRGEAEGARALPQNLERVERRAALW